MKATPTLALAATLAACSPGNPVIDETGGDTEWIYDCEGDNDGVIQFDELPWATGVSVPYVANQAGDSVSVQPHGEDVDGTTVWDFSQAPGVLSVDLDLLDPSEQWFASHFPDASYATPLFVHDLDLLGVISAEEEGFVLQGLVSREEAPELGQTLVVYEDPIATYTFPLELGTTWLSTTSFRDALIYGVPNAGEEHYLFEVDAVGTLLLPGYTLENVLRMRVEVSQTFVVTAEDNPAESVRYVYLRECFGELARITSHTGVTESDFDEASEVRVLDVEG